MDDALWKLLEAETISADGAYEKAVDKAGFRDRLRDAGINVQE